MIINSLSELVYFLHLSPLMLYSILSLGRLLYPLFVVPSPSPPFVVPSPLADWCTELCCVVFVPSSANCCTLSYTVVFVPSSANCFLLAASDFPYPLHLTRLIDVNIDLVC